MKDKKLDRLISDFYIAFEKAQALRHQIMDYIEEQYDIDANEHYADFEDGFDWCYGLNQFAIDDVVNGKFRKEIQFMITTINDLKNCTDEELKELA